MNNEERINFARDIEVIKNSLDKLELGLNKSMAEAEAIEIDLMLFQAQLDFEKDMYKNDNWS